jgi:hypothetical protein
MDFRLRDARLIAMSDTGVIAKEEDPAFWNILRKQIFGPENSILGPSFLPVPSEPMQEDDAASLTSIEIHRWLWKESLTQLWHSPHHGPA